MPVCVTSKNEDTSHHPISLSLSTDLTIRLPLAHRTSCACNTLPQHDAKSTTLHDCLRCQQPHDVLPDVSKNHVVFISLPQSSQASIHVASGPRRKGQRSPESVNCEAWMYASFCIRRCQMLGNASSQVILSATRIAFLPVSNVFMRTRRTFCAKASEALCGPRTGKDCSFCHNSCTSSKTLMMRPPQEARMQW